MDLSNLQPAVGSKHSDMENFRPSRPAEKYTSQRYGRKTGRSTGCRGPPQAVQTADNR